tara:strand:+ start:271 stop:843 length:573 start_codon:yes stop_codon:yes gene_type:complete
MLRVIIVNTGNKFSNWYTDNLKYMIDKYSNLNYDKLEIIDEEIYEGVFDKLQMFNKFKDGQNIFFDLDVLIKGDCNNYLKNDLTICYAWWRDAKHTPLNSSVISWFGDVSYIYDKFNQDPDYYMIKYWRGIDKYLEENFNPQVYDKSYNIHSYKWMRNEDIKNYNVILFNQRYQVMKSQGFWTDYFLQSQ